MEKVTEIESTKYETRNSIGSVKNFKTQPTPNERKPKFIQFKDQVYDAPPLYNISILTSVHSNFS
jgi:hypothetical protein